MGAQEVGEKVAARVADLAGASLPQEGEGAFVARAGVGEYDAGVGGARYWFALIHRHGGMDQSHGGLMEGMRSGLRRRLRRTLQRVGEQHRSLREIAVELDRALASGSRESVDAWLTRMRDGLAAHFELEEKVVFPALHGLDPTTLSELEQLERDHGRFLALLVRELSEKALAPAHLKGLRERLGAHEQREEHLLARTLTVEEK